MPSSPLEPVPLIVRTVLSLRPQRVIDFGAGAGKYGFLLREQGDLAAGRVVRETWRLHIEGVEGYAPNISEITRVVYNSVHLADCREFARQYHGPAFDAALAIEVIEHFTPSDGVEFAMNVLRFAPVLVIATPKSYFRQDALENELEWHRSWWPAAALRELARRCSAELALVKLPLSSVAVLCKGQPRPGLSANLLKNVAVAMKDALLPERAYYRAIGGAGPSILDVPVARRSPASQ